MRPMDAFEPADATELARECLYRFLAATVTDPHVPGWRDTLRDTDRRLACHAAELLRDESSQPFDLAFGELPTERLNLEPLLAQLERPVDVLQEEYDCTFGLVVPRECPPYETEYHRSADASFRSQQLADVAGFYSAFGLQPATRRRERPDFLGLELEFMALVLLKKRLACQATVQNGSTPERVGMCREAERKFFAEHLAWWVPVFTVGLRRKAGGGLYAALADVLAAYIAAERRRLAVPAPATAAHPTLIERQEEQFGCAACPTRL